MRVVLAGASGFVGERLLARLGETTEVYALSRSRPRNLAASHHHVPADLSHVDADRLVELLPERVDAVVHLAVSPRHRDFPDSAADLFAVNCASVASLAEFGRRAGAGQLIYGSTGAVYADDAGAPQREDSPTGPSAFWAAAKLAGEAIARGYSSELSVWVPRLYFPYGPDQIDRLVPNLIATVAAGRPVSLAGDDGIVFPPIWVDDVVDVLHAAIVNVWSGTMNVAGPEALSLREVAMVIGRHLTIDPEFIAVDGDAARFEPDLTQLHTVCAARDFVSFDDGVARLVAATVAEADL